MSGYFYHRRGAEPWTRQDAPSETDWYFANGVVPAAVRSGGTSFSTYLQGVSEEEGLLAELEFRRRHFESMRDWPDTHADILTFRYEEVLGHGKRGLRGGSSISTGSRVSSAGWDGGWCDDTHDPPPATRTCGNPRPGQWRDHFTPAVTRAFDEAHPGLIARLGYSAHWTTDHPAWARILCVTSGLTALVAAGVEVGRRLAAAGHEVTFASEPAVADVARAWGLRFDPLEPSGYADFLEADARLGWLARVGDRQTRRATAVESLGVARFRDHLAGAPPDLALIDLELHEQILGAWSAGVRVALLNTFCLHLAANPAYPRPTTSCAPGSAGGVTRSRWVCCGGCCGPDAAPGACAQRVRRVGCDRGDAAPSGGAGGRRRLRLPRPTSASG